MSSPVVKAIMKERYGKKIPYEESGLAGDIFDLGNCLK
jgi:hypothetical protein